MVSVALALLLQAATPAAAGPVAVEIVASGHVDAPAQRFRFSTKIEAAGADEEEAKAALERKRAGLTAQVGRLGAQPSSATAEKAPSFLGLLSGMAGIVPSVTAATLGEDGAEGTPAKANVSAAFDATDKAAAVRAMQAAEAAGATVDDPLIPLLIDPTAATRQAKAAALAKAQDEAKGYAAALGLSRPTLIRVSEKQDLSASFDFVKQILRVFARPDGAAETVPVDVTLTVEFRLDR